LIAYLRLVRVGTLFSPAADVVAGMCLAGLPWSASAVRAAAASVLVYAAGMALNDHADRAEDARQRPERPIPSGRVAPGVALALGLGLLLAGVALSPVRALHAGIAAGVLAYDYVLKRSPVAGALAMGALRAANLTVGALVLSGLARPPEAALFAALGYAVYITAVTLLGHMEDERNVSDRVLMSLQATPPLVATLTLAAMPRPFAATQIAFALTLLFLGRARRLRGRFDQRAIRGSMTWLLLGTMMYTALLCLAAGRPLEALGIAAAIPLARRIARAIALT
jgi:4-hydroxybenzoate polyprenyltransferase